MSQERPSRLPLRSLSRPPGLAGGAWLLAALALSLPLTGVSGPSAGVSGPSAVAELAVASTPAGPSVTVTWSNAEPPTSPPPLRAAVAAYDGDTSSVVLFGGVTPDGNLTNNTWVWNGRTWTLHPASAMTQAPPARQQASMAFDPSLHQLILFGGVGAGGALLGDTWAWNGASWYQLASGSSVGPSPRREASLAYDPAGDLVLFGGVGAATVPAAAPTTTSTTTPGGSPTNGPAAGGTGTGSPSGSGIGSGSGNAGPTPGSTPGSASGSAPKATAGPSAQDTSTTVAPASTILGDTWQWTSQGWVSSTASGPAPRWGAALAYDSTSGTTVLYSGNTALPGDPAQPATDTWTWNGATWTRSTPRSSPPGRFDAVMADDPAAGGALLLAGNSGSGVLSDAWVWTGSAWSATYSVGAAARSEAAGAYDAARSALVVFGGAGGGTSSLSDTELVTTTKPPSPSPSTTRPVSTTRAETSTTLGGRPPGTLAGTSTTTTPGPATTTTTTTAPGGTRPTTPGSTLAPGPASPYMSLQTSVHNVHQGAPVRLAGSGFQPGSTVTVTFHSTPSRSTPALVGSTVADPLGDFTTVVSVPDSATPGEHHFVATGMAPDGRTTELLASVFVLGAPVHKGTSAEVKGAMVGLALLIPAGAWFGMTGLGWWRRRAAASAGRRPAPPT